MKGEKRKSDTKKADPKQSGVKKSEDKAIAIAMEEMKEEQRQPLFSESVVNVFNTGYVTGMSEALSLLDEDRDKEDHLKK